MSERPVPGLARLGRAQLYGHGSLQIPLQSRQAMSRAGAGPVANLSQDRSEAGREWRRGDQARGSRTVKQLPSPGTLATSTVPPIASASSLVSASPSPAPPSPAPFCPR